MKRLFILILVLLTLSSLSASFSPSFTLKTGADTLIYDKSCYPQLSAGIEISIPSYRVGPVTLSIPVSIVHNTASKSRKGLLVPSFFKNGIGVEITLDNRKIGGGIAFFYGYEDYSDINAVLKYMEGRISFHFIVNEYFSLLLPVSWTYTPDGNEVTAVLGIRIGGEIK